MKNDRILIDRANKMRKNPTPEENKMWHIILKNMEPKFTRQKIIGHYIVDFYCSKLKLIIEIDGEQHYLPENEEYENKRTAFLEKSGCKILRFYNSDINKLIRNVEYNVIDACKERAEEIGKDIEVRFIGE